MPTRLSPPAATAVILGILAAMVVVLLAMGRVPVCECGSIKLWYGVANGPEGSQHVADWYTLSHVVHGLLFYGAAHWLMRRHGLPARAVVAAVVEAAWEIVENTPQVIARYRDATIALGYNGDSVLNSMSDVGAMLLGFALAARLPAWAGVVLVVALELAALLAIRDNLTLNVLMLVWPTDAVRNWQAG